MRAISLSPDVIGVLDNAIIQGTSLQLTGQLDRSLYTAVNKALEAIGGKWCRKSKAHVFPDDPSDRIESAILTGQVVNRDKELDFFPTPAPVAERLVDLALLEPGLKVLEPSAGGNRILDQIPAFCEVSACEIDDLRRIQLRPDVTPVGIDFLQYNPGPIFDRVIANPPFSRRQDIHHFLHMWECLKPGGRIVCIMSAGILFREDKLTMKFRDLVPHATYEELPEGTFRSAGTDVRTVIVCATKKVA